MNTMRWDSSSPPVQQAPFSYIWSHHFWSYPPKVELSMYQRKKNPNCNCHPNQAHETRFSGDVWKTLSFPNNLHFLWSHLTLRSVSLCHLPWWRNCYKACEQPLFPLYSGRRKGISRVKVNREQALLDEDNWWQELVNRGWLMKICQGPRVRFCLVARTHQVIKWQW